MNANFLAALVLLLALCVVPSHGSSVDPSGCRIVAMDQVGYPNSAVGFIIQAFDTSGAPMKTGGEHFEAVLPYGMTSLIADNGDGTYSGTWRGSSLGEYSLHVNWVQPPRDEVLTHDTQSTFTNPPQSTFTNPPQSTFTNPPQQTTSQPPHFSPSQPPQQTFTHPPQTSTKLPQQTFTKPFTPKQAPPLADQTTLEKQSDRLRIDVQGSPFSVFVISPPRQTSAFRSYADGTGVDFQAFSCVGRTVRFVIHARDVNGQTVTHGNDSFTATIEAPNRHTIPHILRDNLDGTYSGFYVPNQAGLWRVTIKLGGINIEGSPYRPVHKAHC